MRAISDIKINAIRNNNLVCSPEELADFLAGNIELTYQKGLLCAGFARRSAEIMITGDIKDKKDEIFNRGDAWEMVYRNKRAWSVEQGNLDLSILKAGQILGIYRKNSIYNHRKDSHGEKVRYTHAASFAGMIKNGDETNYLIAHNMGGSILVEDLFKYLKKDDAKIVDIFMPKI